MLGRILQRPLRHRISMEGRWAVTDLNNDGTVQRDFIQTFHPMLPPRDPVLATYQVVERACGFCAERSGKTVAPAR